MGYKAYLLENLFIGCEAIDLSPWEVCPELSLAPSVTTGHSRGGLVELLLRVASTISTSRARLAAGVRVLPNGAARSVILNPKNSGRAGIGALIWYQRAKP